MAQQIVTSALNQPIPLDTIWVDDCNQLLQNIQAKNIEVSIYDDTELANVIQAVQQHSQNCITCNFHKQHITNFLYFLEKQTTETVEYIEKYDTENPNTAKVVRLKNLLAYSVSKNELILDKQEELIGRIINHLMEEHGYGYVYKFWLYGIMGIVADLVLYSLSYFDITYWIVPLCSIVGFFIGYREDYAVKKSGKILS